MSTRHRWLFALYNTLLVFAFPWILVGVALRWRQRVFAKGFERWAERWGHGLSPILTSGNAPWWWVHAVSLGEVKAIEPFLRRAPTSAGVRVLLSVVTPEALAWVTEKKLGDQVIAAPFDLPWVVRRVFKRFRPTLFISVESELWPNLLREAKRSGARVALINARISERSCRRYRHILPIIGALWPLLDLISVREPQDAERFQSLGVGPDRLRVTGHLKYDLFQADVTQPAAKPTGQATIVIGSTREGEERLLLPVIEALLLRRPQTRIIWAPRHLQRVDEVAALLAGRRLIVERKSAAHLNGNGLAALSAPHVLWDTMGDLIDAYRSADIAVIGGSFVPKGGQNPIEAAALKCPVLFGPSMENFKNVATHLVSGGGARQVALDQLGENLAEILEEPALRSRMGEQAQKAVQAEQGATDRTLELLKTLVYAR